jgi:DNA-binding HxlR family transcriptional regulator
MLKRTYDGQMCSVARALEVVGERWTILIVRDALLGARRFDDFRISLNIARNVLAARLEGLVQRDVLEKELYHERPPRYEYHLTPKGMELATVLVALMEWGDRHRNDGIGPPRVAEHKGCGGHVTARLLCERCAGPLPPDQVTARPTRRRGRPGVSSTVPTQPGRPRAAARPDGR